MDEIEGAYSLVLMSAQKLICARDPHGFRPLCYGVTEEGVYVVASESCALSAVGARFVRDVEPGEIIVFTADGPCSRREHCGAAPRSSCVFEYIYFARPDSVVDGVSVHAARLRAGGILAEEHPVEADVVVGVPDSGLDAALGYARACRAYPGAWAWCATATSGARSSRGAERALGQGKAQAVGGGRVRARAARGARRRLHRARNHGAPHRGAPA